MIFYQVQSEAYTEDGVRYFATQREAMYEAYGIADETGYPVIVHKVGIPDTTKASILRLANNEQWASVYEEIFNTNKHTTGD